MNQVFRRTISKKDNKKKEKPPPQKHIKFQFSSVEDSAPPYAGLCPSLAPPQEGTISCVQWENSWSSGFNLLILEALTISLGNTPVLVTCHFYNSAKELTGIIIGNEKYLLQGLSVHPYYTMLQSNLQQ
jgi:hypothetical protein